MSKQNRKMWTVWFYGNNSKSTIHQGYQMPTKDMQWHRIMTVESIEAAKRIKKSWDHLRAKTNARYCTKKVKSET